MLYPTAQEWKDWGIKHECHQFFCLHWTELFDPETPDTWQVRACNIKTILRELIDASRIADGFDAYRGVMRSILDEAFAVIKRDAILENFYPFVSAYLEPWRKGDIGEKAVPEVDRLARVILGNLEGYWENGVKLVKSLLEKADKGKKKELYAATTNLAIETVARGRSLSHIREQFIATVLIKSDVAFLGRVEAVFAGYAPLTKKYRCIFLTEGIGKGDAKGLPPDIKLSFGRPTDLAEGPAQDFFKLASNVGVSLIVELEAADPEAARRQAEKRLGELFAAKNLFSIDDRFGIKVANALVDDVESGAKTIVGHRRLGSHYLGSYESRNLKVDLLFRVQEHLQKVSPSDAAQLAAALEYHRLALLATSDEARLVNLWIALEALCQGGEGSIIERVWSRIAPCVAIDNVRRTLVSLSIFVKNLWTTENRDQFLALLPNSTKDHLDPQDLAKLLLLPDGHEDLKTLCKLCLHHPLLLHRLFRAKTMMLERPGTVRENIEYTRQNVEWQIKRIYRVRNAIVHTGGTNLLLPQLTQHLHCYLVKAIICVLTDLDRQPLWRIRDSLEHRLRLFDHVVALFGKMEGHKIAIASIMDPEACMVLQTPPFAWPSPAPPTPAEPPAAPAAPPGVAPLAPPAGAEAQATPGPMTRSEGAEEHRQKSS
jgi:hypothetical protein